jgi:hypothetical protein
MIREKVLVSDFDRISKEYDYYIWHFINKNFIPYELFSYFEEPNYGEIHPLREILDEFEIPYFESYVEDSVDFILNRGITNQKGIYNNGMYSPVFMGFKNKAMISSTMDGVCYCPQGAIEIICKTLTELPLGVKEKYLK